MLRLSGAIFLRAIFCFLRLLLCLFLSFLFLSFRFSCCFSFFFVSYLFLFRFLFVFSVSVRDLFPSFRSVSLLCLFSSLFSGLVSFFQSSLFWPLPFCLSRRPAGSTPGRSDLHVLGAGGVAQALAEGGVCWPYMLACVCSPMLAACCPRSALCELCWSYVRLG